MQTPPAAGEEGGGWIEAGMQSDWKLSLQARATTGEFSFIARECFSKIPTLQPCWKAKGQTTIHVCQLRRIHAGVDAAICLVTKKNHL